jgi:hypothetical protein
MIYAILVIAAFYFYFQERNKKKVAYVLHIQERTEEAETLDFAVTLYQDETPGIWREKMEYAFKASEERRKFNNDRLLEAYKIRQEEAKELMAAKN